MESRKAKYKHSPALPGEPAAAVRRDQVEAVQRRAGKLTDAIENRAQTDTGHTLARHRQQKIQRQLAHLRSEAMQARRLAEQISNLSQDNLMNDAPTIEHKRARQPERRVAGKPRATGSQSRFNPLHPSMELPPEQLIRLLGLEDKPARKQHKAATAAAARNKDGAGALVAKRVAPVTVADIPSINMAAEQRTRPASRRRATDLRGSSRRRPSLLLSAGGIGLAAGIILSAYFFWWQPSALRAPALAAHPATATLSAPRAQPASTPPAAKAADKPPSAPGTGAPAPAPLAANPQWRKAVATEEQRLLNDAKRRLSQRLKAGPVAAGALARPNPVTRPDPEGDKTLF